ncbi:hypothetical protein M426DRAFT_7930 [Hypoxylon sp. CI-4A]|nr:hypothetical protein M426DRAFT_7930 [Hypoxylon sp. CI-4A]
MYALRTLTTIGLTMLPLLAQTTNAWLVEMWDSQPNCGDNGGAADTERGGVAFQENCSLLGLEDVKAAKISDWDDGCKVSFYNGAPENAGCLGDPVWEKFKEEVAHDGRLVDNNWSCQIGLEGKGIMYVQYSCGDDA